MVAVVVMPHDPQGLRESLQVGSRERVLPLDPERHDSEFKTVVVISRFVVFSNTVLKF